VSETFCSICPEYRSSIFNRPRYRARSRYRSWPVEVRNKHEKDDTEVSGPSRSAGFG
jgi:hypothetical protein